MNNKIGTWLILIISPLVLIVSLFFSFKDCIFFLTRRETSAKIVSITKPSDYKIKIIYYNKFSKKQIASTIKLKSNLDNYVENFQNDVSIYYGNLFPQNIYIKGHNVPSPGILIFDFFLIAVTFFAFLNSFGNLRKRGEIKNE